MRNAIVNAGLPTRAGPAGRTRTEDLRVLASSLMVITLTTGVLALNAAELWPHLFAQ